MNRLITVFVLLALIHYTTATPRLPITGTLVSKTTNLFTPHALLATPSQLDRFIEQTIRITGNHIIPYQLQRFQSKPDGNYRLHCRVWVNWIHLGHIGWEATYAGATNVIAIPLEYYTANENERLTHLCYLTDGADETEAACQLEEDQQEGAFFPRLEKLNRSEPEAAMEPALWALAVLSLSIRGFGDEEQETDGET